jgi:Ca-activated chloride channel family protein
MRFADPVFLVVAAVTAIVLAILFVLLAGARRRALAQLGSFRLLPSLTASLSRRRRFFKQGAVLGGAVLFCLALARPQLGFRWEEAHRRGVDILFAIDTSKSMLTKDIKPNRLERAKLAVRSLVEKFPNDRVGLVAFAGSAFVETPLTLDHGIFDESVAALDTHVIPLGGTNIASAIDQSDKALSGDGHRKVLVLITDGEDLSGEALEAAERAAKDDVVIYTLGVGTPSGELIPVLGDDGQPKFVRDEKGALVTSRLDESLLSKIAHATGGDYRLLGDGGQGLEALYRDELSKLPQSDLASRSVRVPLERYQWPLALGLLLLGIEPIVSERRRQRAPSKRARSPRTTAAAVGLAALLVAPAALASPQSAEKLYKKGDFAGAERDYAAAAQSAPRDARLSFNVGAAAFRKGDFDQAAKAFESTLRTDDLGLQEQAYYNLGNASYRLGEGTLAKNDIDATKTRWKQAIDEYEGSLRLRADDADARYNLELVKRRLAELDKKQEQQKNDQQKQQPKKKDGKQDQKQKNGQGDKQDQKQNGQGDQDQKQLGQSQPQPGQQGATPRDEQAGPGELSKADAEALLDSLRGDLKLANHAHAAPHVTQPHEPQKDW